MYEPIDATPDALSAPEEPRGERRPFVGRMGTLLWLQAQDVDRAELGDPLYYVQSIY